MPQIVTVNLVDLTATPSLTGFGKALILTKSLDFAFKDYDISAGLSDLANDFATTTDVYKIAQAIRSQVPFPGELSVLGDEFLTEETDVVSPETLSLVSGNTYSFANTYIKVGLLSGLEDNAVAIPDSDVASIDYKAGQITFETPKTGPVTVDAYTYFNDISDVITALTTLQGTDDTWRYIVHDFNVDNYRAADQIAAWTEALEKYHIAITSLGKSDFPLDATTYDKTRFLYTARTGDDRLEGSYVGYVAANTPGTYTTQFKEMPGIPVTMLTPSEENTIRGKGIGIYVKSAGLNQYFEPDQSGIEFTDQQILKQYIGNQIELLILTALAQNKKISGTSRGLAVLVAAIQSALTPIVSTPSSFNGLDSYTVDETQATFNSGTREWSNIIVVLVIEGATHTVIVNGNIQNPS